MATTLIFVRHGESEGNRESRFNGNIDLLLTERGREQARKTAVYLRKYKIDKIYASDLKRAFETAQIIAQEQKLDDPIEDKALREIFGGDFEGKIYSDLGKLYPVEFEKWLHDLGNCRCPNGESIRELLDRFSKRIKEIAVENEGKTILIGTHAMPIRVMSTLWSKKDITEVRDFEFVRNASVTVVDYSDVEEPVVIEYDVAEHLGELVTQLPKDV